YFLYRPRTPRSTLFPYTTLFRSNKKVVPIISGGNVDVSFISRIIERGMVESGRFMRFRTILKDKPGNLEKILEVISELNGNILDISLSHIGDKIYQNYAQLSISIETKNQEHKDEIYAVLKTKGYETEME